MGINSKVIFDSNGKAHTVHVPNVNTSSDTFKDVLLGKESALSPSSVDPFPTPEYCANIRPNHYGGAGATYEVFNVLEAWDLDKDFYLGNVIKYVARAGKKDPSKIKEDLEKALVYLQRRIDSLK